jgi:hypothetical protein
MTATSGTAIAKLARWQRLMYSSGDGELLLFVIVSPFTRSPALRVA